MGAEAAVHGRGVDEPREGRAADAAEIVALGVHELRDALGRIALGRPRQRLGAERRRVDDGVEGDLAGVVRQSRVPLAVAPRQALDAGVEGKRPAGVLEVALERQHERVAVDDPGLR